MGKTGKTRIENCIRKLRFEHDEMTQQDLAERVDVTRQTINAIELGKYSPSLEVAFKISRVFGKPLEAVFSWPQPAEDAQRDAADETRAAMEDKNGA
jgi:putative transcriptional regulator